MNANRCFSALSRNSRADVDDCHYREKVNCNLIGEEGDELEGVEVLAGLCIPENRAENIITGWIGEREGSVKKIETCNEILTY